MICYGDVMETKKVFAIVVLGLFFIGVMFFSYLSGFYTGIVMSSSGDLEGISEQSHGMTFMDCPAGIKEYTKGEFTSKILLPAVLRDDEGVTAYAKVSVEKGTGNILFNTGNVLVNTDTQQSIRKAALVASNITNISLEDVDLVYDLYADAAVLEGPSAGAAFTIATIAAFRNQEVSDKVMITGTINHDGVIGPSGKIIEKAKAAKESGAELFLVPKSLSVDYNISIKEFCKVYGTYEYCDPEFTTTLKDVEKEAGIKVIEVSNITEAYKYFVKD